VISTWCSRLGLLILFDGVMNHVDLVVVVHKSPPWLLSRSFDALAGAMGREWTGSAILVENASPPEVSEAARTALRDHFPSADRILIRSLRNRGFGSGVNVGVAHADGRYVGVFNLDGVVREDTVAPLEQALEREPTAFMAGARLLPFSAPDDTQEEISAVDWLPGAAGLYRRAAFLELGGFDPLYFMYSEDVDLSRRARREGWLLLRVPRAVFHHEHQWATWERIRRLRMWTVSATTLSYQYAPSRLTLARELGRKRLVWFQTMAEERRWAHLTGALLGTAVWPIKVPQIEYRRRHPWNAESLHRWLRQLSVSVEREVASSRIKTAEPQVSGA
jgi:GT2 family glycosyltransferase